ncbi:DUF2269 family protein [Streptomyces palmae]|uniref:DUF2269 family protein n=1 Tax=Streptomyces palmae TaxID=1701085 RepID=A0A4Z0FLD4_9ACTN|nr:DUF2269 family protein [Streptomyces palmae]TGA83565.1 DUF2269 family protein [Streptomyces palmae]
MNKLLLVLHVLAAILAFGPVAIAASMFPPAARRAWAGSRSTALATAGGGSPSAPGGDDLWAPDDGFDAPAEPEGVLRTLYRICRVYAVVGVAVPVSGIATARGMGVLGDTWVLVSLALTVAAAVVLALLVLPGQQAVLTGLRERADQDGAGTAGEDHTRAAARLAMYTGIFNLLWAVVTVLMIVRPGSSTGV